jgi:site-specific recombinase XerD
MPTDKTAEWLQDRREEIKSADYSDECSQSILDFLDAHNPDTLRLKPPIIEGRDQREDTLTTSSRLAYASTLHRTATWTELTECVADDLNQIAEQRLNGDHHSVSSDGITQNTVNQNQIAWRSYARFHQNHPEGHEIDIDPEEIILVGREDTSVDEREMFDAKEIEAMRTACRNKRDRAVLELLIYTGQRHAALRWLTVKDVQPDEGDSGMLYIPEREGMKGASGKRPLLGAQKAVREWKDTHPTGNPEDAFITHIWEWDGREDIEQGDHLSKQSFGQITKRIADRADVEKPANPHQFRHYFVTMAVSKHGMSFDTVRHLIGHAAGSRELERTYQHLVDEDYIENAELDMGIREEREESLTPPQCFTCNEPLDPSNNFCPNCGHTYSPQAAELEEDVESAKAEGALAATDAETQQNVQILMDLLEDDEKLRQLQALYEESDAESLQALADSLR